MQYTENQGKNQSDDIFNIFFAAIKMHMLIN